MSKCQICGSESEDVEEVALSAQGVFPGPGGSPTEFVDVCGDCRDEDDPEELVDKMPDADDLVGSLYD